MEKLFETIAGKVAGWAGRPPAFVIALVVVIVWGVTGPIFNYSDTWQLIINTGTTIVTFLMVFLIQNAQNRDASAMQAKLDELIRAVENARGSFIAIEHLTDRQIQEIRTALEKDCSENPDKYEEKGATVQASVERLLARY
jgi:low affinity Fe/Cu permease